jgi:hypothetical protein
LGLILTLCRLVWPQALLAAPPPDTVREALAGRLAMPAVPADGVGDGKPNPSAPFSKGKGESETARREKSIERWVRGLDLFGQKTIPFRWVEVSGSANARRAFENNATRVSGLSELTLVGRLLDLLELNVTLSDDRYGTDSQRIAAKFRAGDADVSLGDVNASLAGNSLIPFQRRVRGVVVEHPFGKDTRVTALLSTSKAPVRRVTIPGNNTVGPYYLNAFPIEVESVRVRIDETDVPRDAYTVDPYAGTITFRTGQIVPQTSVLRISFATRVGGESSGTLYGARASHTFAGGHTLGITAMGQQTPSGGTAGPVASRERIDDWPAGHADSVGPFQLRYGPVVRGTEQVFVGGVLQRGGLDYLLDPDRGILQFTRLVLSSEAIRVIYRQAQQDAAASEPPAALIGIDGTLRLGPSAQVTAQLARSGGGAGSSGNAVTLEGKVGLLPGGDHQPRLRLGAALKSLDPGFAPIDNGSFLRNERGLSLEGEYDLNSHVRLFSRWQQGRRPIDVGALRAGGQLVDARERASGVTVRYPGWPALTIQSTRLTQEGSSGEGRQDTDSVRLEYGKGRVRAASEWSRGETAGQNLVGTGTAGVGPARTETAKVSVSYTPSDRLSLSTNAVTSQIRSVSGGKEQESSARSLDLNATYRPSRTVAVSADYVLADGGGKNTLVSIPGSVAYAGNQRTGRLGVTYTPGNRASLSASLDLTDSELHGETLGRSLAFSLLPAQWLSLTGSLSRQSARYDGLGGITVARNGTDSDLTYLSLKVGPVGKLTFDLDYQGLVSRSGRGVGSSVGSLAGLASDVQTLTGRVSHPVGEHTAFMQYQQVEYGGNVRGRKGSAVAGVDLRLGRVLGLTLDVELHRYRDALRPADSYRARIISGNLSARF